MPAGEAAKDCPPSKVCPSGLAWAELAKAGRVEVEAASWSMDGGQQGDTDASSWPELGPLAVILNYIFIKNANSCR